MANGTGNNSAVAHRHRLELLGSKTKQFEETGFEITNKFDLLVSKIKQLLGNNLYKNIA